MVVTIVDYRCGNLTSLQQAFKRIGFPAVSSNEPETIETAEVLVLPGVGHFGHAVENLEQLELRKPILTAVASGVPLLGICLGMQLLADWSEEAGPNFQGLGLVPGQVRSLKSLGVTDRIPHIGWNELRAAHPETVTAPLLNNAPDAYFVHSFAYQPKEPGVILATTSYGVDLVAAIKKDNVWGSQFHPEKSSLLGLNFLTTFLDTAQISPR
jgi:glutamine amidotransferase